MHAPWGESAEIEWAAVEGAGEYEIELSNASGKSIRSERTTALSVALKPPGEGNYRARVRALRTVGPASDWSDQARLEFAAEPPPPLPAVEAAPEPPKREVAAVEPSQPSGGLTVIVDGESAAPRNEKIRNSMLEISAIDGNVFSREQVQDGATAPTLALLGARWLSWGDHVGVEAKLQAQVATLAGSAGNSMLDAEARVHARAQFTTPFKAVARRIQTSVFLGAEAYRNPNQQLFITSYEMLKVGATVDFTIGKEWATGGEVAFGSTAGGTQKMEVSGFLTWFLTSSTSLNGGYRVHLLTSGDANEAPGGLPYREAYGEIFSALQFHY